MTSYKRIRVVGKGSFGCCWLVKNEAGEQCILKEIDVSTMSDQLRAETATEVAVLSKLRHPFIIQYREAFLDRSLLCIVMDFAERGDLHSVIERQKKSGGLFPETLVLRWFTQIVLALKHIHERHILHRDLKTQNIFLAGSGQGMVKVGDFGVARVLQNTHDCARTYVGTPFYCSPEICKEQPYSYKSDIWSLGCVLYEMATLRHAFNAYSMRHLLNKILGSVPPDLPAVFSQELQTLITQMLAKDPRRRPSACELLHSPIVRNMMRQLVAEFEKQKDHRPEKGRCISPVAKDAKVPAARRDVPTPPKVPKVMNQQKDRRPSPAQATKQSRFVRPRSASRESLRSGRSPSPAKQITESVTFAKVGTPPVRQSQHDAPKQLEVEDQFAQQQCSDLIRTLEEGLSCKESAGAMKDGSHPVEDDLSSACLKNPEGDEVKLRVTEKDSLAYRIEALRLYIEEQLGISEFLIVYKHLTESTDIILSSRSRSFLTLVTQLIVCEDEFYAS
eukprot:Skav202377  [mRNA]  locus=scaffold1406:206375:207886:+ [translate_table: standard]